MLLEIEKSCLDRDKSQNRVTEQRRFETLADKWHPAARLLFIVGSAGLLWTVLLKVLV